MKLFPISALTLLCSLTAFSPAQAAGRPSEGQTCSTLSAMLFDVQLNQRKYNQLEFQLMDKILKKTFTQMCEGGDRGSPGQGRDSGGFPAYSSGQPMLRNGSWVLPNGQEYQQALFTDAASDAAILQPFLNAHRRCAPGCGYVSWGIWGDARHQAKRSCHNSGQAIDIHAITCGGTHAAGGARFNQYVRCMGGSLGVIYGSGDHKDHAHFQLHGCNMCAGKNCGGGKVPKQPKPRPGQDDDQDDDQDQDNGDEDGGEEEEE